MEIEKVVSGKYHSRVLISIFIFDESCGLDGITRIYEIQGLECFILSFTLGFLILSDVLLLTKCDFHSLHKNSWILED